ncbi:MULTISPECIES: acyl-CoA synthetase [unclassified Caballeronia]|uniref:acyl-CoA synthetase n=1 Tax=unclassified Caballeronia TaxID=2646786 RepID=UPI002866D757|nr:MULTISPECIES: acyl-CoA synthetase [unclassified Caballeronia]MDR5740787.1 acyl-CoA synthetase [Caballeronia sp. LZ016]MDR5808692.1 acyl-CoA synthetase [Caballeronia sp. LZ019]
MTAHMYDEGLPKTTANFAALTPLTFIERAASVYPQRPAIVHGEIRRTWGETYARTRRLASALIARGIGIGDTVAAMLSNTPEMVEAHFGVPMTGAVLNTLNTRLDAATLAFMLTHGEAKAVLVDREFAGTMKKALEDVPQSILVIDVDDSQYAGEGERIGEIDYEALLAGGDPAYEWSPPSDEWNAICLNYTSGTTGNPKGVVYHHRGAYTNAISNILEWDMPKHAVYLWTLPMFHCNGWCFPWTVAARAGVNVCLRKVDAKTIFDLIRNEGVTHYCGAPIVQNLLVNAPEEMKQGIAQKVHAMVAGAAPPAAMIEGMERLGFELTHVYGLTEVYGPATVCAQQAEWRALDIGERARLNARQGVRYHLQDAVSVLDPLTMQPVAHDGETIGEIMFRGNIAMKGYLKNAKATGEAFSGGWFHTGDLAVAYPDGYVRIKDRSKDIIISGGENISSIEVEDVLYRHPAVLTVAVVAKPDARWGETPCAFVETKPGAQVSADELIAHCKAHLAGFKVPRAVEFCELPKTSTGKIQKFELRKRAGSVAAIDV